MYIEFTIKCVDSVFLAIKQHSDTNSELHAKVSL